MKTMTKSKSILMYSLFFGLIFLFSCAKQASGIRGGTVKSAARVVSPVTSDASTRVAEQELLNYSIKTLSTPTENDDGSFSINTEIKTPQGNILPIKTTHLDGQDAYGIVNDSTGTVKLDVRARCIGSGCEKYLLMVTVVKNGYAYHQLVATSLASNEDTFNYTELNSQVTNLYRSLDEAQNNVEF